MQLDDFGIQIARLVLARGPVLIEVIADDLGLTDAAVGQRVRTLCMERLLKRDGDRVTVLAKSRLESLIAESSKALVKATPPPGAGTGKKPKFIAPQLITIEKGVPIPEKKPRTKPTIWPFATMEVGDSFSVDVPDIPAGIDANRVASSIRSAAASHQRRTPEFAFAIRISDDRKTVRLWRDVPKNKADTHDVSNIEVPTSARRKRRAAA